MLPEYSTCPPHLASRTALKKLGLSPTEGPVATLRYRTPAGWASCNLYSREAVLMVTGHNDLYKIIVSVGGKFKI